MSLLLLQLSLFAAVTIKLTSSQSTYDVTYHDNDVTGCGSSGQIVQTLRQLMTVNSQLLNAVSQLQKDVAELKNASSPSHTGGVKGKYCEVVKQPIRPMHGSFYSKCWTTLFHFYIVTSAYRTLKRNMSRPYIHCVSEKPPSYHYFSLTQSKMKRQRL